MKQFKAIFLGGGPYSGFLYFLHNSMIVVYFFALVRLYSLGFWLCLVMFLLGHLFLAFVHLFYTLVVCLLLRGRIVSGGFADA